MTRPAIGAWLARLSDPRGVNASWPAPTPIDADDQPSFDRLLFEAQRHSVHMAFFHNLLGLLRSDPPAFVSGTDEARAARVGALVRSVTAMRLQEAGEVMVVAAAARDIRTAAAGLPVALVKGLDFAEAVFGGLQFRPFGDVDLLLDPSAEADMCDILTRQGFAEQRPARDSGYTERQWVRPHPQLGYVLVELHTDLVHSERIRRRISLTHARYATPSRGGVTFAARLVLAAIHASTSHLFGRLQYVVDGMMIARAGVDPNELRERAVEAGAVLPLRTMLRLGAEIYASEECRALLEALPRATGGDLERHLISAGMVLAAKGSHRWRFIPQRRLYKRLLRG